MIHIVMALYDRNGTYAKFVGTCMESIFANTEQPVTVHILHDETLIPINRERLCQVAGQHGQAIRFYDMQPIIDRYLAEHDILITERFSPATLYRLLMAEALPQDIDKVIYLDADIIVNLDIRELWQAFDDETMDLAAVPEGSNHMREEPGCWGTIPAEDYFNAGVLIFKLQALRDRPDFFGSMQNLVGFWISHIRRTA